METLLRQMMDRAAADDEDAWMHRCLSLPVSALLHDVRLDVSHATVDMMDAYGDGILDSEPRMSSFNLPAPTASCSGSSLQACFSPAGPPSTSVTSGLPSKCVIAPPADQFDRQGVDADSPGRKLERTLKRPHWFESPVGRVTGDKCKKKKGNIICTKKAQDDSYAHGFYNKSAESFSVLQTS